MADMTSVSLDYGDTHLEFSFTWGVFDALRAEWGDEFQPRLGALFTQGDTTDLAFVASIASGQMLGPDTFLPQLKVINALYRAYELGWSGRDIKLASKEDSEDEGKKPRRSKMSSTDTLRRGWGWGWLGKIFSR